MKTIYNLRSCLLAIAMLPMMAMAQGDPKLTIEDITIQSGGTTTMAVSLENPGFEVTDIQFDVKLPEGLTIPFDEQEEEYMCKLTERASKHTLLTYAPNGVIRFCIYGGTTGERISGTSGVVLNITVKSTGTVANPGNIQIQDITISDPTGWNAKHPANFQVAVKNGTPDTPTPTETTVEVNFDETKVDVAEIKAGNTVDLPIIINNGDFKVYYMQFDVALPEGLSIEAVEAADRMSNLEMAWTKLENGEYRVQFTPVTMKTIKGTGGAVCTLKIKGGDEVKAGKIVVKNIEMVDFDEIQIKPEGFEIAIEASTTGIETISNNAMKANVYNLQGVKVLENASSLEGLSKGIYIVNGKKVVKN